MAVKAGRGVPGGPRTSICRPGDARSGQAWTPATRLDLHFL